MGIAREEDRALRPKIVANMQYVELEGCLYMEPRERTRSQIQNHGRPLRHPARLPFQVRATADTKRIKNRERTGDGSLPSGRREILSAVALISHSENERTDGRTRS